MSRTSRFSMPRDSGEEMGGGCQQVRQWAENAVDEQPLSTLFGAFAAGFVMGAGAVAAYCASQPARMSHSDQLSTRIAEAVSQALPASLKQVWRG